MDIICSKSEGVGIFGVLFAQLVRLRKEDKSSIPFSISSGFVTISAVGHQRHLSDAYHKKRISGKKRKKELSKRILNYGSCALSLPRFLVFKITKSGLYLLSECFVLINIAKASESDV